MFVVQESPDGIDIGDVMTPWLEQRGFPLIEVDIIGSQIVATQTRFLDNPAVDRTQPPSKYKLVQILEEWSQ